VLSAGFWPGFRFQVPPGAAVTATSIGVNLQSGGAGTIFGAIVRLTGSSDAPDAPDLTGADVLAIATITVPGGALSVTATEAIAPTLAPGWYAAVFGTGAFGATLASARRSTATPARAGARAASGSRSRSVSPTARSSCRRPRRTSS
jgi:hypothetical protein